MFAFLLTLSGQTYLQNRIYYIQCPKQFSVTLSFLFQNHVDVHTLYLLFSSSVRLHFLMMFLCCNLLTSIARRPC